VPLKVFVDANLLFYKLISDLLFDASNLGLIVAHWSEAVIAEYLEHGPRVLNEKRKRDKQKEDLALAQEVIHRKVELFKEHSGFILVEDYDEVEIPDDVLSDKDDTPVLKAALKSNCSVLLTLDKDFRKVSSLRDLEIVAKKADGFFCELFDKHEDQMLDVINKTREGLSRQRNKDIDLPELIEMMKVGRLIGLAQKLSLFLAR
jgi:predicted nucleic acid-binding protein